MLVLVFFHFLTTQETSVGLWTLWEKSHTHLWTFSKKNLANLNSPSGVGSLELKKLTFLFTTKSIISQSFLGKKHVDSMIQRGWNLPFSWGGSSVCPHITTRGSPGTQASLWYQEDIQVQGRKSGMIMKESKVIAGNKLSQETSDQRGMTGQIWKVKTENIWTLIVCMFWGYGIDQGM